MVAIFDASLFPLKVSGSKKPRSFLKMQLYFPSMAKAHGNSALTLGEDVGGARPRNAAFSSQHSSPLLEMAVVLSVINEGVITPFR